MKYEIIFKDKGRRSLVITEKMFESLFDYKQHPSSNLYQYPETLLFGFDEENNNKLVLDKNAIFSVSKVLV